MANILEEFRKFATRGNVIDLAIGFTVGAAFSTVARSLVDDVIMPFIALATGEIEFTDKFIVLRTPADAALPASATLEQAREIGAITFNYGLFIQNIIIFLLIAVTMFFLVRAVYRLDDVLEEELGIGQEEAKQEQMPADKKCPYCVTTIPRKAVRCPNCTSDLSVDTAGVSAEPAT